MNSELFITIAEWVKYCIYIIIIIIERSHIYVLGFFINLFM